MSSPCSGRIRSQSSQREQRPAATTLDRTACRARPASEVARRDTSRAAKPGPRIPSPAPGPRPEGRPQPCGLHERSPLPRNATSVRAAAPSASSSPSGARRARRPRREPKAPENNGFARAWSISPAQTPDALFESNYAGIGNVENGRGKRRYSRYETVGRAGTRPANDKIQPSNGPEEMQMRTLTALVLALLAASARITPARTRPCPPEPASLTSYRSLMRIPYEA